MSEEVSKVVQASFSMEELEEALKEESSEEDREREALFALVVLAVQEPETFNAHALKDILREFKLEKLLDEANAYVEDEAALLTDDDEDDEVGV